MTCSQPRAVRSIDWHPLRSSLGVVGIALSMDMHADFSATDCAFNSLVASAVAYYAGERDVDFTPPTLDDPIAHLFFRRGPYVNAGSAIWDWGWT
jgi:hypothetical protein